jgi:hypothetical protein
LIHCPPVTGPDQASEWVYFDISEDAQLVPGPVYLRLQGLSAQPLLLNYPSTATLHPEQEIIAVLHFVGLAKPAAELARSSCEMIIFWDATGRQVLKVTEPFEQ